MANLESRFKRLAFLAQAVALLSVGLATAFYFSQSLSDQLKSRGIVSENEMVFQQIKQAADKQLKELNDARARNDQLLQQLSEVPHSNKSESARQLALLQREVSDVHSQLSNLRAGVDTLYEALGTTPEKALMMPLLKKDVDDLKTATQRDIDSLRGEIARSYDLNKWLIGLILAAVLGTVINSALQSRAGPRSQQHKFE